MIFKIFNSFFFGVILISLLDFILFLGLKINYFNALKIDEYFNPIFVQNQNFYLLLLLTLPVGYLFIYSPLKKAVEKIYFIVFVLFMSSFIPSVGMFAGEKLFLQKDLVFTLGSTKFQADLLYKGREFVYLKRDNIKKTIKIEKDQVTYE